MVLILSTPCTPTKNVFHFLASMACGFSPNLLCATLSRIVPRTRNHHDRTFDTKAPKCPSFSHRQFVSRVTPGNYTAENYLNPSRDTLKVLIFQMSDGLRNLK